MYASEEHPMREGYFFSDEPGYYEPGMGKKDNCPLHVGISLRLALRGTLSGSLSVTLADESWKSLLIEDKKYN